MLSGAAPAAVFDGAHPAIAAALDGARRLESALAGSIESFALRASIVGDIEGLASAVSGVLAATRGHRIGRPSTDTATDIARRYLGGEPIGEVELDRLAWALCTPVGPAPAGKLVAADPGFPDLLRYYRDAAGNGSLWRVTWLGLLASYFAFERQRADAASLAGWQALRETLRTTWPALRFPPGYEPDWAAAVRAHPQLLSDDPCSPFAADYLAGERARIERLERDLGIPRTSWFWRDMLLAAVDHAIGLPDAQFRRAAVALIAPMRARPAGRDAAIGRLLERWALCVDRSPDPRFRDFVIDRDVWKNPKLMPGGGAPAWSALSQPAWRMALGWVSEAGLRLFFDVLVEFNEADEGRREFWSRYRGQIAGARLAIGARTLERAQRTPQLAQALALQDGDAAQLRDGWRAVDAILIEIGGYVFVEFSVQGSTCYAYPGENLPFDPDSRSFSGGSADLKAGYYYRGEARDLRIPHGQDWPARMAEALARIGVHPDRASAAHCSQGTPPAYVR